MAMEQKNKEDYSKGLLQSEEMYQYTLETFVHPREHRLLKELRDVTASHPHARMGTAPDAGQMISMLLNMTNAKRTIEVGVFTGYSLLLTALKIPVDGKIVAIDLNRDTYEIGLPIIQKAGVEHKIEFVECDALSALDKLLESHENEGSFDYAFVDADKVNYLKYHERLLKLLKVDGLAVYDNTLWGGTVSLPATEVPEFMVPGRKWTIELNKSLATDSRVQLLHAPLGDGITVCRKTGSQLTMENSMKKTSYLKEGLLQSEELFLYILETSVFPREAEVLKELRVITQDHPSPNFGTSPDAGQLLAMLLKLIDAKKTIEIGVFTGYSLLVTALSIPDDGQITAIDINRESYEMGLPIIKKAGLEHKINFIESPALPILDKLLENHGNEESFDFVYVDADKNNYFEYHERLLKLLKVSGIIVYDNTLNGGRILVPEESIPEQFRERRKWTLLHNKFLASDQRIQICHVPVGDGSIICRRVR